MVRVVDHKKKVRKVKGNPILIRHQSKLISSKNSKTDSSDSDSSDSDSDSDSD